jgi:hypothetical protein
LTCGWITLPRGQDVSWDLLNYHWYYSWLLFHGGIGQADPEPFANRFINPLAQLPWYAIERLLSPRPATFAIALLAGVNLVLVRHIALRVLPPSVTGLRALLLSSIAMVLAGTGAVFRTELGMSLADVIVSLPILGALLLVLGATADRPPVTGRSAAVRFVLSGVLSGVAVGAKLTMAPYAVALALCVVYLAVLRRRTGPVLLHTAGGVMGLSLSAGWWFWSVWRATGNPVFPFYNSVFGSPLWRGENFRDVRFGAHGVLDALQYPLYMAQGTRRLLDVPLRDPRWLVLSVLLIMALALGLMRALRGRRLGTPDPTTREHPTAVPRPAVTVLAIFFLVSGFAWFAQFGYARYGVTNELLVGPVAVVLLLVLFRRPMPVLVVALLLAIGMVPLTTLAPYMHRPFAPTRFEVDAGPLLAVPPGSVVIADATGPHTFLLSYLRPGVRRHVVHPWFYDTQLLARLQVEQLASAPRIYLIVGSGDRSPAHVQMVRDELGLQMEVARCVPVHSIVQLRLLCPATWVGASVSGSSR